MNLNNCSVRDVCEVFVRDAKNTKKAYYLGNTKQTDITQKIKQEQIRAGIGNGVIGTISQEKEIQVKVQNAINSDDILQIQSGMDMIKAENLVINKNVTLVCDSDKTFDFTDITDVAVETNGKASLYIFDKRATLFEGVYDKASKKVEFVNKLDALVGETYVIVYPAKLVEATYIPLDSASFPKTMYVELHSVAYDLETNEIYADIFWIFDRALPDGNISKNYSAKNMEDAITFTVQKPFGRTTYGKYVVVPRKIVQRPLEPSPKLVADSTTNNVNAPIDITFPHDANYETAIFDVTVDGLSVGSNKYTVASGMVTIDGSKFTAAKDYVITLKAKGYADAIITQKINA